MLYLLPAYLSAETSKDCFAPIISEIIYKTNYFFVENEKTARKIIKFFCPEKKQSEIKLFLLDKYTEISELQESLLVLKSGENFALLSEAGLPCIADPGNIIVRWCHKNQIEICPIDGPSSIILALISSGFNGQNFAFHGYLSIDKNERKKELLRLEEIVKKTGASQIFMETPYRNNALMDTILATLQNNSLLSISANIQHPTEQFIRTKTIAQWKKEKPDLHKIPAIFVMGR